MVQKNLKHYLLESGNVISIENGTIQHIIKDINDWFVNSFEWIKPRVK